MNKELIKKYKKEFDWWLNGGEIAYKYMNSDSWTIGTNIWNKVQNDKIQYIVIKDAYFIYRKALAEGKTIQYLPEDSNEWKDCVNQTSPSRDFLVHPSKFRIKPEEPKFKVGDFVKDINDGYIGRVRVCMHTPLSYHLEGKYPASHVAEADLELWEPEEGEWCLFWNKYYVAPLLEQFSCITKSVECSKYVYKIKNYEDKCYEYCAPYGTDIEQILKGMR